MLRYAAGRLVQAAVAILGVLTIVFIVMRFSGDPTLLLVLEGASQQAVDALRKSLGFDQPIIVQYLQYPDLANLDFGVSVVQRIPAFDIVTSRIPYTVALATGALIVAIGIGIPAGIVMAVWRGSWLDRMLATIVLTWTKHADLPLRHPADRSVRRAVALAADPRCRRRSRLVVLPSIALGALSMSTFARMARIAIIDELSKDYVRAAWARGMSKAGTVVRHVLRNAAIPVVTVAVPEIGNLLAGAVIVETVFAWPGIGQLAIQSIQSRDFLVVQLIVLMISTIYVLTSLLADLVYALIDPRIRLGQ